MIYKLLAEFVVLTMTFIIAIVGVAIIVGGYQTGNILWMIFGILVLVYLELFDLKNEIKKKN